MSNCPVCNIKAQVTTFDYHEWLRVRCPRCGYFEISNTAIGSARSNSKVGDLWNHILSYWIRKNQKGEQPIKINATSVDTILTNTTLPSPPVQLNNLIKHLGVVVSTSPDEEVVITPDMPAIIGAKGDKRLSHLLKELEGANVISLRTDTEKQSVMVRLTLTGWERFEQLTQRAESQIDNLLDKLDPSLKQKRIGAWMTFQSENPDRLSQAANSMVELLDKVIGKKCQGKNLSDFLIEKYGGNEEAKWIDATRKWISETKSKLHRVKHHPEYDSANIAKRLLSSAEQIILTILE